jgi:hypothetical protein
MQRDWDLVRTILKKIQDNDVSDITGYESKILNEHMKLLAEAGLIERHFVSERGSTPFSACRLTWQGHDFIESSANENLYKQAIQKAKAVGSVSFEIVKAVIAELAKQAIFGSKLQ